MSEQLKQMREIGFVPLVVLEDEADAVPLATALQRGGIPVAEVTFRTEAALSCIGNCISLYRTGSRTFRMVEGNIIQLFESV